MQPKDVTPRDVLDGAIDRLQRTGWTQGLSGDMEGPNCLTGAAWFALYDLLGIVQFGDLPRSAQAPYNQAMDTVAHVLTLQQVRLPDWNDAPERTQEDVLLALKQARHDLETADET